MTAWLPVWEVAVRHAYHAPAPVPALHWRPTATATRRLAQAGAVWRPTPTGIVVYAETRRLAALHAKVHDAADPFVVTLCVRSGDGDFARVTDDVPAAPDGEAARVWLFDSARAEAAAPPDAGWRPLHAGEAAGAAEAVPLDAPPLDTELAAADRLVPPAFVVRLGLPPQPDAAARPDEAALQAWAGTHLGQRWRIALRARATHWKYLLPAEWETQQPQVVDLDARTEFTPPVREPLGDGRVALASRSRAPIALQRRPAHRFQLHALAPVADKVLVRRLPAPAPGALWREAVDGQATLVSEIHVPR